MSAANPNPIEKSMVSVLIVENAGGGSPLPCGVFLVGECVFQTVFDKLNNLTRKVDKMALEEMALHKAYH
jgi:hypothetical protein